MFTMKYDRSTKNKHVYKCDDEETTGVESIYVLKSVLGDVGPDEISVTINVGGENEL